MTKRRKYRHPHAQSKDVKDPVIPSQPLEVHKSRRNVNITTKSTCESRRRNIVNFQQVCKESQIDPATKVLPATTISWGPANATSTATSGELERVLAQENASAQRNAETAGLTPEIPPSAQQIVEVATSQTFIAGQREPTLSETEDSEETVEEDDLASVHSATTDIADSHQISLADFANSPQ
ncbi:unnamed protein product [Allacma fusca]|uniref:Uncharacterized protein n=1 Tax=Allacma fusca TaxID=39272 RepID=A0A8J2M5M5_9HEXA|nr:unnamed protein product [Allacma fusca]